MPEITLEVATITQRFSGGVALVEAPGVGAAWCGEPGRELRRALEEIVREALEAMPAGELSRCAAPADAGAAQLAIGSWRRSLMWFIIVVFG